MVRTRAEFFELKVLSIILPPSASFNTNLIIKIGIISKHTKTSRPWVQTSQLFALLGPILAAAPTMHHVSLSPKISDAITIDNVTEIATFYGLASNFESGIGKFLQVLAGANGFKGISGGAVVEELEFESVVMSSLILWDI